uniref:Gustatory receptor n=1 Tax=Anopheles culicifacies TaxID=139723 RepID=A0A182LUN3_9DIPT
MQPNIRALRAFGLFPFSVVRTAGVPGRSRALRTLKSEVKFMDVAIFTVWQTVFLQMLYTSWPKVFFEMPVSRIMGMVTMLLYLIGGLNCSISATLVLVHRKKFIRMMELVEEADHIGLLFVNEAVVGHLLINATSVPQNTSMQVAFFYYYTVRTVHVTCVISFIGGLYSFRERLLTLNRQLRTDQINFYFPNVKHDSFHFLEVPSTDRVPTLDEMMSRIQGFTEIYSNLCDAIRLYCSIFVLQGRQTAVLVHKAINQSSKTPALVERIISAIATYSVILIQFELGVPRFFISGILQHSADVVSNSP